MTPADRVSRLRSLRRVLGGYRPPQRSYFTRQPRRRDCLLRFGIVTIEGGYRYQSGPRFRDTRETTENPRSLGRRKATRVDPASREYEKGKRDRSHYDTEESEDASFTNPGPPANLLELRRFDQAKKDIDRFSGLLQLTPFGDLSVSLSYLYGHDDFSREPIVAASGLRYGLLDVKNRSFTAEADYSPTERWSVYGFYTREEISNFQRGRQSGGSLSTNPLDDWTSDVDDKGGFLRRRRDRRSPARTARLPGLHPLSKGERQQRSRKPAGGTPDIAFPISAYDDTKIWTVSGEFEYRLAALWSLALGGWIEDYEVGDRRRPVCGIMSPARSSLPRTMATTRRKSLSSGIVSVVRRLFFDETRSLGVKA